MKKKILFSLLGVIFSISAAFAAPASDDPYALMDDPTAANGRLSSGSNQPNDPYHQEFPPQRQQNQRGPAVYDQGRYPAPDDSLDSSTVQDRTSDQDGAGSNSARPPVGTPTQDGTSVRDEENAPQRQGQDRGMTLRPEEKSPEPGRTTEIQDAEKAKTRDQSLQKGREKEEVPQLRTEEKKEQLSDLSPIERALSERPVTADKVKPQSEGVGRLTQFGYNFFKPESRGFAPQTDVPVGPDYVIASGDRIVLTVWGSIDATLNVEVNRSGDIVLPKIGAVKVAGQSFGQLPSLLKAHLGRVFKDFHLNVNMGKIRLIRVYVVGEVANPGGYSITSLSTVINALAAAGGPTKNGSLRNIQINRNGKVVETVDLYDLFLKGDKGKDIRLQAGDTIFVPVVGPVAGVAGNVRRPGIYELKGEKSLKDLLLLADGINPSGYLQRIQLFRVQAHEKKMVTDVNLDLKQGSTAYDAAASIPVQDYDLVKVLPIDTVLHGYVRLTGHVLRPGDFALKPGMRVSSLLKSDDLLPEYYPGAGQIIRLCPPDQHPEVRFFDLERALKGEPEYDLELKEFDQVRVYARKEMEDVPYVKANGDVKRPGKYRFFQNMTVRDLLLQAGNIKRSAFMKSAEITRVKRNGDTIVLYPILVDLEQALQGGDQNIKLEPMDELTVRRIPNWAEDIDRYVMLKGEFLFPGIYPIYRGEHLSSVIQRAGGFTDKAFLPGAKFTRRQVKEIQQKRMDEILNKAELDLSKKESEMVAASLSQETLEATKASLEGLKKSVDILRQSKAEGRLVVKLAPPSELRGSAYDLELQGGDVLAVPSDPKMVSVYGQVYNPASFVFVSGEEVRDYLKKSGGATRDADLDQIYLIKADGSVESSQNSGGFLGFGGFMSHQTNSGDTLVVPQRIEKVAWLRDLKDIAAILGNLAITAGVLIAAGL